MPPSLPRVTVTRYVTPLREGGSLPGVVEGDDLGTYVAKFHGAGQGPKALVAEVIVTELARRLGLPVPDLVLLELDPVVGRAEPDQEIQDLLRASAGTDLGVDLLPSALGFEPTADEVDPALAARVVWLDAYTLNVDRSWRNPNLLWWGRRLWLIDHGAALYVHHDWSRAGDATTRALPHAEAHVLLPWAGSIERADAELAPRVTEDLLREVVALVPDEWLTGPQFAGDGPPDELREAYAGWLLARAAAPRPWVAAVEALRADAARPVGGRGAGPAHPVRRFPGFGRRG